MGAQIGNSRNLFEFDNARYLSADEMASTFIPTKSFWRLLSAKNHVVLGARGSGKTAIARMLAHQQLAKFKDKRARQVIQSKAYIGLYVPTKAEWIGGLKNKPWMNENQKEEFFRWRLNVATCVSFLATIRNCLNVYIDQDIKRIRCEIELCRLLTRDWFGEATESGAARVDSLARVGSMLEDLEFRKQQALAREHITQIPANQSEVGLAFHTELFSPLRRAIRHSEEILSLPETSIWMLCLDEAEALESFHQRILNSFLRTHSGNLVFKMTTTPYGHYTLETNVGAGLSVGHDFEYVYIDRDFLSGSVARGHNPRRESDIFRRRAARSGRQLRHVRLADLLGPSPLLQPMDVGKIGPRELEEEIRLYGDKQLISRAAKLEGDEGRFGNEIKRKVLGAVLLRRAVRTGRGQQEIDIYCGAALVARCSDGNPRRMIRLFNKLLLEGDWQTSKRGGRIRATQISAVRQTQILRDFSISTLERVQAEPEFGPNMHRLLQKVGQYMNRFLHAGPLSTDQVTSLSVSAEDDPINWPLIKSAVGLGLLYPNIHPKNPDELPENQGVFHLAYVLTPAFNLMPRRGKSRRLSTIIDSASQLVWDGQLSLLPSPAAQNPSSKI